MNPSARTKISVPADTTIPFGTQSNRWPNLAGFRIVAKVMELRTVVDPELTH